MPRALMSVYDKTGLVDFATTLSDLGWDLVASGGTERALRELSPLVTPVEQLTGFGAMLGGRVKTLHPALHAPILARNTAEDMAELTAAGFAPIDMVVCNLYPFQQTVAELNTTLQDAIEQIDIGGVALLRAAAKNFFNVIVVSQPDDYNRVAEALRLSGSVDIALRRQLAVRAFAHTRDYDTAIHAFLSADLAPGLDETELPQQLSFGVQRTVDLRYGENPHQAAGYYSRIATDGPLGGDLLGGKPLSYNNILDLDAAWRAVSSYAEPAVVIVKHLTPTGIAVADTIAAAYQPAYESDSLSAFGGVIAVNRRVDDAFVAALGSLFVEAIAAPAFTESALLSLRAKRKNCRLLRVPQAFNGLELEVRSVHRGFLVQRADTGDPASATLRTMTERIPTDEETKALVFAWRAVQHVKSNAIVIADGTATVGIGGGLPSRVDAVQIAAQKAGERARGAALASDAFFPFPDGVEAAAAAGVTAVIQPGGSIRDSEVIAAANAHNITMVFTGTRHFRH